MSRFIILEDRMINVDHIVEVVDHDDGVVTICLTNSEMIPASSEVCDKILGCDHAVSVIPCGPNLWARMTYPNGKTFRIAVDNLILKADGTYYPLEAELLEDSSEAHSGLWNSSPMMERMKPAIAAMRMGLDSE